MISRNNSVVIQESSDHEDENSSNYNNIELSLGLSLNGKFGVDPNKSKTKLIRSSSIPDDIMSNNVTPSTNFMIPRLLSCNNNSTLCIGRTFSLPAEIDEEWKRRKEVQMLRRLEAKRKRSEKQFKSVKKEKKDVIFDDDCRSKIENCPDVNGLFLPSSQGSIRSQGSGSGSGSSNLSEYDDSLPVQGMNKYSEARSPSSVQSLSECEHKSTVNPAPMINRNSGSPPGVEMEKGNRAATNCGENAAENMLEDMPFVSTKGDGPNGKRIEGFLYQYRKGEEVRIVCVCHGSFLSPAEFVKHAGGGDVTHPLKHIVVNPYPL